MNQHTLTEIHRKLSDALSLIETIMEPGPEASVAASVAAPRGRNPAHFKETGHLSDEGIAAIYHLFDGGHTIESAARQMGISIRGAAGRRAAWDRDRARERYRSR